MGALVRPLAKPGWGKSAGGDFGTPDRNRTVRVSAGSQLDELFWNGYVVRPTGIEPILLVPETSVLSVELRAHSYIIPFLFAK